MQLLMFVSVLYLKRCLILPSRLAQDMVIETHGRKKKPIVMVMGVRDYVHTTGFKKVCLGLSGGVDSALTLAVAVDALGAENVHAMMMPTRYTAQMSLDDAKEMAQARRCW